VRSSSLAEVGSIDGSKERTGYEVVVRFKRETPFGSQIVFRPRGLRSSHPHPIVAELRAAVGAATHA